MTLKDIVRFRGELDRGSYLVSGLVLFGMKYYLDRSISWLVFKKVWFITDYFIRPDEFVITRLSDQDVAFYTAKAVCSIPFIYIGTLLCVKRLRSAGLSPWLTVLFFIPMLNLILFLILSILPSRSSAVRTDGSSILAHLIPRGRLGSVTVAIGITVFVGIVMTLISTNLLKQYGWGLFMGTPFFISFTSVIIYGYHEPRRLGESLSVAFLSVAVFALFLLALAVEGLLCIVMGLPLGLILALIGGTIGYAVQIRRVQPTLTMLSIALSIPLVSFYESDNRRPPPILSVKSEVIIDAEPERVWQNLIGFSEIEAPSEILFLAGIAYPQNAKILGAGSHPVRHCIFNTGTFVEPIQAWEAPRLLQFTVQSQPEPLTELSPYKHLDVPHLHGLFTSTQGQFELSRTGDGKTLLEGSTWYKLSLWPASYWKLWSDYIIHTIHLRVLGHIKRDSEGLR